MKTQFACFQGGAALELLQYSSLLTFVSEFQHYKWFLPNWYPLRKFVASSFSSCLIVFMYCVVHHHTKPPVGLKKHAAIFCTVVWKWIMPRAWASIWASRWELSPSYHLYCNLIECTQWGFVLFNTQHLCSFTVMLTGLTASLPVSVLLIWHVCDQDFFLTWPFVVIHVKL